jgi:radical SAM superfamily enzyme YgiQ (UPF0313 family)
MLNHNSSLLFISLDWYRTKDPKTPLAIASIEAYFRKAGPQNLVANFNSYDISGSDFDTNQVLADISQQQPAIIAIGVYIWNESYVQEILQYIRQNHLEAEVILGGPQITFGGNDLADSYPGADWFIRGAGEVPFTNLVDQLTKGTSPLASACQDEGIYHRDELKDNVFLKINQTPIEQLPSPFLSGIVPINRHASFQRWETLRGCPYRCTFCQFKIESMKPKELPHDRIFAELELFHQKRVHEIAVLDPIFNYKKDHYLPILQKINELGMKTTFSLQTRLELLTRDHGKQFLEWAAAYKNVKLEFGVQTFIEAESKATQRGNHYGQIDRGIELLHQYGVDFELHLIIGLPFQTRETFLESYRKAVAARPNRLYIYPLNILKGTDIYDQAHEWGYEWNPFDYNIFEASKWMNRKDVAEFKALASEINLHSKVTPPGEKITLPALDGRKSA